MGVFKVIVNDKGYMYTAQPAVLVAEIVGCCPNVSVTVCDNKTVTPIVTRRNPYFVCVEDAETHKVLRVIHGCASFEDAASLAERFCPSTGVVYLLYRKNSDGTITVAGHGEEDDIGDRVWYIH